ncbi:hypothetical protein [Variovorax paradoxus]|uniref:hypothetical protein n=1 Tax=Variovorax paradoxus TaxID=34073 RepID=UPI003ECC898C
MWKPAKPLTKFDADIAIEDAWINEFARSYYELCEGRADHEFVYGLAEKLMPIGVTVDPRKVAELAMILVSFEMPGEG